jgi:CAAX prenyl protease-like protein
LYCRRRQEAEIGTVIDNPSVVAGRLSAAAARCIPFAVFIGFIVLQSVAGQHLAEWGLDARWMYTARAAVATLLLWLLWRHYTELHTFTSVTPSGVAVAAGVGLGVFIAWINLDFGWARIGDAVAFDPTTPDGSSLAWPFVLVRLLGLALVVPVMEELFWRSFLLRWLERSDFLLQDPAKVGLRALAICAAMFALEHTLWLAGLAAGFAYALVYMRSGSLWLAIVSHATTNAALGCWIVATRSWQFW